MSSVINHQTKSKLRSKLFLILCAVIRLINGSSALPQILKNQDTNISSAQTDIIGNSAEISPTYFLKTKATDYLRHRRSPLNFFGLRSKSSGSKLVGNSKSKAWSKNLGSGFLQTKPHGDYSFQSKQFGSEKSSAKRGDQISGPKTASDYSRHQPNRDDNNGRFFPSKGNSPPDSKLLPARENTQYKSDKTSNPAKHKLTPKLKKARNSKGELGKRTNNFNSDRLPKSSTMTGKAKKFVNKKSIKNAIAAGSNAVRLISWVIYAVMGVFVSIAAYAVKLIVCLLRSDNSEANNNRHQQRHRQRV